MLENENINKPQNPAFLVGDVIGSLPRPSTILEASEMIESNVVFELTSKLLIPLGLRMRAFNTSNFKSSKSLNEGYVVIEKI